MVAWQMFARLHHGDLLRQDGHSDHERDVRGEARLARGRRYEGHFGSFHLRYFPGFSSLFDVFRFFGPICFPLTRQLYIYICHIYIYMAGVLIPAKRRGLRRRTMIMLVELHYLQ